MKYLVILLISSIALCAVKAQRPFNIMPIPKEYSRQVEGKNSIDILNSLGKKVVDLTDYLPNGYSVNGDVDYTEQLQKGINENRYVKFPNFPVLINDNGLSLISNSSLFFLDKSQLILKDSNKEKYEMLRLHNINHVNIYDAKLIGDRDRHNGESGEWGMGIAIRGKSNQINIYNAQISNCWGDGIYLGQLKYIAPSNVLISNAIIDKCRRNGISITTGSNITINGALISNIHGTLPESGVVIEPSDGKAHFKNIVLNDLVVFNVKRSGIQMGSLEKLIGRSDAFGEIFINRPIVNGSMYGLFIGSIRNAKYVKGTRLFGEVHINSPKFLNSSKNTYVIRSQSNRGPKIILNKVDKSGGILEAKDAVFNAL